MTASRRKRSAGGPLHASIFDTLRSEILAGQYLPGATLPAEQSLVKRFGVSRHTVREALRHLRDEALVVSRQGLGTVVLTSGEPHQYVYHLNTISDMQDEQVETHYDDVHSFVLREQAETALGQTPPRSRWLRLTGLRYELGEAEPICEFELFLAERFAGVVDQLPHYSGAVYELLEKAYDERLDDVQQLISTFVCDVQKGQRLGLEQGETGIEIRRHFRTVAGTLCMLSYNRYPADRFAISMKLTRARKGT